MEVTKLSFSNCCPMKCQILQDRPLAQSFHRRLTVEHLEADVANDNSSGSGRRQETIIPDVVASRVAANREEALRRRQRRIQQASNAAFNPAGPAAAPNAEAAQQNGVAEQAADPNAEAAVQNEGQHNEGTTTQTGVAYH